MDHLPLQWTQTGPRDCHVCFTNKVKGSALILCSSTLNTTSCFPSMSNRRMLLWKGSGANICSGCSIPGPGRLPVFWSPPKSLRPSKMKPNSVWHDPLLHYTCRLCGLCQSGCLPVPSLWKQIHSDVLLLLNETIHNKTDFICLPLMLLSPETTYRKWSPWKPKEDWCWSEELSYLQWMRIGRDRPLYSFL